MTKYKQEVTRLKRELEQLGAFIPGSISEQWNVCGTPGCKCKDEVKPQKHGPYYQLSFSVGGKHSTMFLKKEEVKEARKRIERYQKFKELMRSLIGAYVGLAREEGFGRSAKNGK